jgi:predicted dehydrogenase
MNVLIVGLGYAGTRFLRAFSHINKNIDAKINFAYVSRNPKRSDITYFKDIDMAIKQFNPEIVVVSVNDEFHTNVIKKLNGYTGFVICEKPLANTYDDLELLENNLKDISGFCLDVVERYSDATIVLKEYVEQHNLRLVRANFYWGKDRINDHRPTAGVTSEIIHPLDLVQWICAPDSELKLKNIQGVRSDFSISGSDVLDSVAITAYLDKAVVTGYSSFVNIVRKREVDLVFASPQKKLVYATMVFDTPVWDIDYLRIWEKTPSDENIIVDMKTSTNDSDPGLETIRKLIRLVTDVTGYVLKGKKPLQPFPDLQTAIKLQRLLNTIESDAKTIGPVKYVVGNKRDVYNDEKSLERLG